MINFANIQREIAVSLVGGDYEDNGGFFIRSEGGGTIKYLPIKNDEAEIITKVFPASVTFDDPVICRKIIASGTTATGIYAGKGQ